MQPFSVSISVYKNDNPGYFKMAMKSILNQTIPPNEIILTVDGPISGDLDMVVCEFENKIQALKVIRLEKNMGLGITRKIGTENCSNQLIAVMDSDDIAVNYRFEKQLNYFEANPNTDIVGSYIDEFIGDNNNIIGVRVVPLDDYHIKKYLKKRCPFNHVTVMFKKDSVVNSGGYQDWFYNEDYFLWCRMMICNCTFGNIPDILVHVRGGEAMYKRRGGWIYYKSERKLQRFMLKTKIINRYEYIRNILYRFIVQIILPNDIRGYIFRKFFRNQYAANNQNI